MLQTIILPASSKHWGLSRPCEGLPPQVTHGGEPALVAGCGLEPPPAPGPGGGPEPAGPRQEVRDDGAHRAARACR